jgi:hypothetical protein
MTDTPAAPTPHAAEALLCEGFCGDIAWTVEQYGYPTHKHGCPRRNPCQSHPDGCSTPAEALPQKSIEQLAAEKGIGPIKSADDLRIHGITDEEADAFIAAMQSEALLRYGRHEEGCPEEHNDPPWHSCECGWADTLARLRSPESDR